MLKGAQQDTTTAVLPITKVRVTCDAGYRTRKLVLSHAKCCSCVCGFTVSFRDTEKRPKEISIVFMIMFPGVLLLLVGIYQAEILQNPIILPRRLMDSRISGVTFDCHSVKDKYPSFDFKFLLELSKTRIDHFYEQIMFVQNQQNRLIDHEIGHNQSIKQKTKISSRPNGACKGERCGAAVTWKKENLSKCKIGGYLASDVSETFSKIKKRIVEYNTNECQLVRFLSKKIDGAVNNIYTRRANKVCMKIKRLLMDEIKI